VENLVVHEKNMADNLMKYGGIIFSQRVLLELINRGISRDEAYRIIQTEALNAWDNNGNFRENILKNKEIGKVLKPVEIENLFDVNYHLQHIGNIIKRLESLGEN
jgi:adenylosuccinate lyase